MFIFPSDLATEELNSSLQSFADFDLARQDSISLAADLCVPLWTYFSTLDRVIVASPVSDFNFSMAASAHPS